MAAHASVVDVPLSLDWKGLRIHVQPPMSQGVLLLMALAAYDKLEIPADARDHASVELTQAAFAFRNEISRGKGLLEEPLPFDLARASLRRGPRSYLHTAGAAAADTDGVVVSSLISVFDDFGSAILVPEGGSCSIIERPASPRGPTRRARAPCRFTPLLPFWWKPAT